MTFSPVLMCNLCLTLLQFSAFSQICRQGSVSLGRPPQRTVIHLHYGEGYATGEIAAILRVPAATVRTRLYRGREKLRELLGGDYEL